MNEENHRWLHDEARPNEAGTRRIEWMEVVRALGKMKNGRTTGPDEILIEAWKA